MPEKDYDFHLRLFISVDLAGSTAFKQMEDHWVQVFESFFEDFPVELSSQYLNLDVMRLRGSGLPSTPEVWKYSGDEILFVVELRRYEDATVHIHVLLAALAKYEGLWREKRHGL